MAEAIDANARNKVYFALAPKDATAQAHHIQPWLDDGDLMRLGGFEVVLRPVAGGRAVRPVTANTLPPPQPIPGRAEQLRGAARHRTGLTTTRRHALLGDAATAGPTADEPAAVDEVGTEPSDVAPGGRLPSNFDIHSDQWSE